MSDDPLRKPRKLRFRVSSALLVSAPLIGSIACGDDRPIAVNPGPEEPPAINVPVMQEEPVMQPEPPPARTNLTVDQALGTEAIGMEAETMEAEEAETMEAETMEAETMEGETAETMEADGMIGVQTMMPTSNPGPRPQRPRMVNVRPPRPRPTANPVLDDDL